MTTASPASSREWSFGPIPTGWRALPLKYLCSRSSLYGANVAAAVYENDGVRFLRTTDIQDDGALNEGGVFVPADIVADYMLSEGDFLISRSGTVGRAYVYRPEDGPCAYAGYLVRYALRDTASPQWLFYITKSPGFKQWLGASVIEATIGNVNGEKYANLLVPVPPLAQQHAIADYLDRETARLDALVAVKERVLGLLAEKRRALITRAVTRSLDPNVPLRDSGIPWLGEIPAHWKIVALRFLVDLSSGATPDTGKPEYWDGEIPWVSPKDMKQNEITDTRDHVSELALSECTLRLIEPGAVLIVVRGMILAHSFPTALNNKSVTINQDMKALRCCPTLTPHYLRDFFHGFEEHTVSLADSSAHGTRKLDTAVLGRLEIPLPPLLEQQQIVTYIDEATSRLDALESATGTSMALLKERRAALIAAAVTGQIDLGSAS